VGKEKGPVYGPRSLEEEVRQTTRLTLPSGYDIRTDAVLEALFDDNLDQGAVEGQYGPDAGKMGRETPQRGPPRCGRHQVTGCRIRAGKSFPGLR